METTQGKNPPGPGVQAQPWHKSDGSDHYNKQKQIRRIKKEQEAYKKFLGQQRELRAPNQRSAKIGSLHVQIEAAEEGNGDDSTGGFNQFVKRADNYLAGLKRKTRKTWLDNLSPAAVRRFFRATKYGRIWMFFQVACTFFSIINYILLTYAIGRQDRMVVKRLDVLLATIFAIDYSIGLYIAEDRLRFYAHPTSLVDLLSIVPPFVYVFVRDTSPYVWFLGLLRILRASRILRTYRLVSFQETEERREITILALSFVNFLFLSSSIINAFEVLQGDTKTPPRFSNWHDSLYYIIVTFSTIGFGDMTPQTPASRVMIMFLIIFMIIYVPVKSSKLTELYNATNQYQRAKYFATADNAHVILAGVVTYTSIVDFCREYYVNDPTGHVVILAPKPPGLDVRVLLRHPYYRNRLVYLCGTALNVSDLRRCDATQATAIFLLNSNGEGEDLESDDQEIKVTRGADAEILMQALVVRSAFPGLPIFNQVTDIRSQDLSRHCGCMRTICMDELKMSLVAKNVMVPGSLALLVNLVHTFSQTAEAHADVPWRDAYQHGLSQPLQTFKIPNGLASKKFSDVALVLYFTFGINLLGIVDKKSNICLCPGSAYVTKHDDVVICILDGGEEIMMRIAIQFSDPKFDLKDYYMMLNEQEPVPFVSLFRTVPPSAVERPKSGGLPIFSNPFADPQQACSENLELLPSENSAIEASLIANAFTLPTHLKDHILVCGNVSARGFRHFVRSIRKSSVTDGDEKSVIVILVENLPSPNEGIWKDIFAMPPVYVIRGTGLKKTNLLQAGITTCKSVVIFSSKNSSKNQEGTNIADAHSIFIVQMIKEEWPKTRFIVELNNGFNVKFLSMKKQADHMKNIQIASIVENCSITMADRLILYKNSRTVEKENIFKNVVYLATGTKWRNLIKPKGTEALDDEVLLIHKGDEPVEGEDQPESNGNKYTELKGEEPPEGQNLNDAFLQKMEQEVELNDSGLSPFPVYLFDKHFAAGMILTANASLSQLCQSYFRPFVPKMIQLLIQRIVQTPLPVEYAGKTYGKLYVSMVKQDAIPIGLYRTKKRKSSDTSSPEDMYVYTNPGMNEILSHDDWVFLLIKDQ